MKRPRHTAAAGKPAKRIPTSELSVTVDRQLCQRHATCVTEAPEVFHAGEHSTVTVVLDSDNAAVQTTETALRFYPQTELNQQVVTAARYCPNHAITIQEAAQEEA